MNLQKGARLGPYEIVAPIGAGGMGEVYRARDTRLNRFVAIKVLSSNLSADTELRERFHREARAISSLSHPNICTLFDVGQHDGIDYLVMEYLEGETLAERISRGALPLDQVLRYGIDIAHALEKAHRQGITHRDLKPGNIILTKAGAKLLDFGLARYRPILDERMASFTALPTDDRPLTAGGTILGTIQYMAPEQLEGKDADGRADIFALGAVLYEMVTGKRPFEGKSKASLIAAILEHEPPPPSSIRQISPPALDRVVKVALAKDPDERWQTAHDLRVELQWIAEGRSDIAASASRGVSGRIARTVTWILLGAAVGGFIAWFAGRSGHNKVGNEPLLAHVARLTHDPGHSEWPTWSPDNNFIALASNRSGNFEIYVRRVDGGQEINVTSHPAEDMQPAMSPDGKSVAFVSTRSSRTGSIKIGAPTGVDFRTVGGDLWVVPTLGGPARRLAADANYPTWHPDGRRIAYVSGPENQRSILELAPEGGQPRVILKPPDSSWEIVNLHYSPSGRWISFDSRRGELVLIPADGGTPRELMKAVNHDWDHSSNRLYYLVRDPFGGTRLQFVEVDEKTGTLLGTPQTLSLMTGILKELAVSRDGQQLAVAELEGAVNLTHLPLTRDGTGPAGAEQILSTGQVIDRYPVISPDGRQVAFTSDRLGPQHLWLIDVESRALQRIQLPGEDLGVTFPYWFRDGQKLVVTRLLRNGNQLWVVAVDGSRVEPITPVMRDLEARPVVSPDGRVIVYLTRGTGQLTLLDLATRQERPLTTSPAPKFDVAWSPDGRWISLTALENGQYQLRRIPSAGGEEQILHRDFERLRHIFYSPDGRWLYFQPSHRNIFRLPSDGGAVQQVTRFPESGLFIEEPDLSPDGRFMVYCRSHGGSSLWLLKLRQPGSEN